MSDLQKNGRPFPSRSSYQARTMDWLRIWVLMGLTLGPAAFVACVSEPATNPMINPTSPKQDCLADNPNRPSSCDTTCTGEELDRVYCEYEGATCSITVHDCTYNAVCTGDHTWTGMSTCNMPEAGMDDAGMDDASTCSKCSEFLNGTDSLPACPKADVMLQMLGDCSCSRGSMESPPGCQDECYFNLCAGIDPKPECTSCRQVGACASEYMACADDI